VTDQNLGDGPELVGRDAQLGTVRVLADGLMRGRGGVLWIEGEPGIGKTALVDALLARVGAAGCTSLRAGGDELMEAFPLRLMAACLGVSGHAQDDARREIAGLLRGGHGAARAADPILAAAERMLELVDRQCARGPLLLVAEDLQWSDEPSLRVWGRLARTTDQIPLLLVGAARPAAHGQPVERLRESVRSAGATVIELRALSGRDVARLAGRIAGGAPGPRLRAELGRAGGNPLYVRALVDALIGEGLVTVDQVEPPVPGTPAGAGEPADRRVHRAGTADAGRAEFTGTPGAVPDSLAHAIGRRLGFLSQESIKTLRLAALLGAEFDAGPLAAVAGVSPVVVADVVAEAVGAGVVSGGERLSFRHEVIQQVLVQQTPAGLRRALHGHIARTLADAGAGPDVVATHLFAMSDGLDPWALDWLVEAPQAVLYGAPSVAADLLARALQVAGELGDERWEALATRQVQVLFLLGRDEQVVELAADAVRRAREVEHGARMAVFAVRSAGRLGRSQQALKVADRALAMEGLPLGWRARLRAWSAVVLASSGELEPAARQAREALADAQSAGDALAIAYAHHAASIGAPIDVAIGHADEGIAVLGEDPESTDLRMLMTYNRLIWFFQQGREQEYERLLPQALVMAERVGTVRTSGILGAAAGVEYLRGAWDEALVYLEGIDPEFTATADQVHLHGLAALVSLHRGDRAGAARHLAVIDEFFPEGAKRLNMRAIHVYEARAVAAEADGDAPRALALLASWLETPRGVRRDERNDEAPYLVRLALAAGDRATARAATEAIEADAAAEPLARRVVSARCCRGQLDDDVEALLTAAEAGRAEGWPFFQAFALEEAAVRLAAAGAAGRARAALTDTVRLYAQLGAVWDIRRADARLRALGVRRGPRSTHRRETSGWGALTAGETRIAELVGRGWSNPDIAAELFLSRRTVQTHVSNILAKLHLHSRVEVIHAMAQQREPIAAPVS
jgi:DNA-binding NarL/FixJ family response regulator